MYTHVFFVSWGTLVGIVLPIAAMFIWRRFSENYEMVTGLEKWSILVIGVAGPYGIIFSWTVFALAGGIFGLLLENTTYTTYLLVRQFVT